jgi:hypothetical protein
MPIQRLTILKGSGTIAVPMIDNRSVERSVGRIDIAHRRQTPSGGRRARAHRMLLDGLVEQGASLHDGRPVTSSNDAVNWLLEQVAAAWDREEHEEVEA